MELNGKTAVITGAGRGIGRATAIKLAGLGVNLVLASRTAAELEAVENELKTSGVQVLSVPTNVTKKDDVDKLATRVTEVFGPADILINAAGVGVIRPTLELSEAEFDLMMDTNVKGTFFTTQAIATKMAEARKGHIINIPGILGKAVMLNSSGYAASKWAVTGMTKAMALDLKRVGIKFTLMHFGGVDSPFWDKIDGMRVQRDKMLSVEDASTAIIYALQQPDQLVLGELVLQPESHQL